MSLFNKSESSSTSNSSKAQGKANSKFSGNKTWFGFAIVSALVAAGLIFGILSQMLATTTYYVLNAEVPARSQITEDMLTEVSASKGTEPRNALTLSDVAFGEVYAKIALNTGDVLSASNTGDQVSLHKGIPEDFVVASFIAEPNNAVGGKLTAGNYIDIFATTDAGDGKKTKSVLRHIIIVDATASATDFVESEDVTDETTAQDTLRSAGVPFLYTVALSEEDAATLSNVRDNEIFLALSSAESDTKFVDKNITVDSKDVFSDRKVTNSGEGTDPNFGQADNAEGATTGTEETTTEEKPAE